MLRKAHLFLLTILIAAASFTAFAEDQHFEKRNARINRSTEKLLRSARGMFEDLKDLKSQRSQSVQTLEKEVAAVFSKTEQLRKQVAQKPELEGWGEHVKRLRASLGELKKSIELLETTFHLSYRYLESKAREGEEHLESVLDVMESYLETVKSYHRISFDLPDHGN